MKEIKLTRGMIALVDDEDYERLSQFSWQAMKSKHGFYAKRSYKENGENKSMLMHREVLGLQPGDGIEADHGNLNKLDNRKRNLRTCNRVQNCCNAGKRSHNTSGYKGVQWVAHAPKDRKWKAQITYEKRVRNLGYFETPELAHEFYCLAADMLHGEFANHGV